MFRPKILPVPFAEHPASDLHARRAGLMDVLMNFDFQDSSASGIFPNDEYCSALLEKICTLSASHLKAFISYQQLQVRDAAAWLASFDELIILNAEIFDSKTLMLKAEKILLLIGLAMQTLEHQPHPAVQLFDFQKVKLLLQNINSHEEQIIYLFQVRADYLQCPVPPSVPGDIPFDQKIMIEVDRIHKVMESLKQVRKSAKTILQEKYIGNEDFILIMKISRRTAQTWRDSRIIGYAQIQKKVYYLLEDVEALVKSNYIAALRK